MALEQILTTYQTPDAFFSALIPALGEALKCDRVFLYLRSPETRIGKVPYCWRRHDDVPNVLDADWKREPESLPNEDPLFAAALRCDSSIFIEDVETAPSEVVNRDFEAKTFGHRALIHAHLCQDNQLWGVLQPCVFDSPRHWTESDREIIHSLTSKITPLAVTYIQEHELELKKLLT